MICLISHLNSQEDRLQSDICKISNSQIFWRLKYQSYGGKLLEYLPGCMSGQKDV